MTRGTARGDNKEDNNGDKGITRRITSEIYLHPDEEGNTIRG
jgi:hypothetical protein